MKIIIETLTGKLFELNVELTDTINAVKKKLEKESNCPDYIQRLTTYAGEQLEDERTVSEYDIQKNTKIYMVHRLLCK